MKNLKMLFMGMAFIFMVSSCGQPVDVNPEDRIIMVNDKLYYGSDEVGPMGFSDAVEGKISSAVKADEIPNKNGQSNFGEVGASYTHDYDLGFIMVQIDGEWYVFYNEALEYPPIDPEDNTTNISEYTQIELSESEALDLYEYTTPDSAETPPPN